MQAAEVGGVEAAQCDGVQPTCSRVVLAALGGVRAAGCQLRRAGR